MMLGSGTPLYCDVKVTSGTTLLLTVLIKLLLLMSEYIVRSLDLLFDLEEALSSDCFVKFVTYFERLPELPFFPLASLLPLSLLLVVFFDVLVEL